MSIFKIVQKKKFDHTYWIEILFRRQEFIKKMFNYLEVIINTLRTYLIRLSGMILATLLRDLSYCMIGLGS